MLDSHPRIACGPELKVLPGWLSQWEADRRAARSAEGTGAATIDAAYRAKIATLLDSAGEPFGKPRIAEKSPNNVFFFGHLHQLFPDSPLIHVIRDGRDVVASLLGVEWYGPDGRRTPYTESAEAAARYWAQAVAAGVRAKEHLGGRVLELRYENLASDPEGAMRAVLEHVGEPWDEAVLHHAEHRHDLSTDTGAERLSRPVDSSAIGRWRERLSRNDLETVVRVAGDALRALGYLET